MVENQGVSNQIQFYNTNEFCQREEDNKIVDMAITWKKKGRAANLSE